MNEARPLGDAVLIQMSWSTEPHKGAGQGFMYLEVNDSVELDSGSGLLLSKHQVTYLGEGSVVVEPLPRRFIGILGRKEPVKMLPIQGWNK